MTGKTVLILGGGIGGIVTANAMRDRLTSKHRVILIDKRMDYVFSPSLLWVMVGWRRPERITKDLRRLVRPGVEITTTQVQEIDPDAQMVMTSSGDLANGKPLPKAGVFAEGQGQTVALRIAEEIEGKGRQAEFDGLGFCWIETGGGMAGFASGEFYAEPDPVVPLPHASRMWHWGKILFEKYWLGQGLTRLMARTMLRVGSKILGVSGSL